MWLLVVVLVVAVIALQPGVHERSARRSAIFVVIAGIAVEAVNAGLL